MGLRAGLWRSGHVRRSLLQHTVQLTHTPAMSVWHQVGLCAYPATDHAAAAPWDGRSISVHCPLQYQMNFLTEALELRMPSDLHT